MPPKGPTHENDFVTKAARFSKAALAIRLINFKTSEYDVLLDHQACLLTDVLPFVKDPKHPDFWIDMWAFASKKGSPAFNLDLSIKRAQSVEDFLVGQFGDEMKVRIRTRQGMGESESTGDEMNNDAKWRAVELHVYRTVDDVEDPPPAAAPPHSNWSVRVIAAGAGKGKWAKLNFALVTFRNDDTQKLTHFAVPAVGVGIGKGKGKGAKPLIKIVKETIEQLIPSLPDAGFGVFVKVRQHHPFTMRSINGDTASFIQGRFLVYGKERVKESNGTRTYRTVDILSAEGVDTTGVATGGPLLDLWYGM